MVKRSKGSRSKTRKKLRKRSHERGLGPITRTLQVFEEGQRVAIDIEPSFHKGQPHPRFQGLTGTVTSTQGEAYVVTVRTGGKRKEVIARPEHLKPHGAADERTVRAQAQAQASDEAPEPTPDDAASEEA